MTTKAAEIDGKEYSMRMSILAGKHRADTYYSERCQPYRVRMGCGHVETRMMREATAGIPWQKDLVIDVPTAKCEDCSPKARSEDDTICLAALVELVRAMLLRREGEVVTLELARERARNIAAALQGLTVVDRAIPEKGEDDEHDPKNA